MLWDVGRDGGVFGSSLLAFRERERITFTLFVLLLRIEWEYGVGEREV